MKKYVVTLTADERDELTGSIAAGKAAARRLTHARILLKADAVDGGPGWADDRSRAAPEGGVVPAGRAERGVRGPDGGRDRGVPPAARRDATRPVVGIDESSGRLAGEVRAPLPTAPGTPARYDYEYEREGTANPSVMPEPLPCWRRVTATDRRTAKDFAEVPRRLVGERHPEADGVVLVTDDLNAHDPGCRYEAFEPDGCDELPGRWSGITRRKTGRGLTWRSGSWPPCRVSARTAGSGPRPGRAR